MAEKLVIFVDTQASQTGDVTIRLRPDPAPEHVEPITNLASNGFCDRSTFHRVIDGFMAQGRCPKGTGGAGKISRRSFPANSMYAVCVPWSARRA